MAVLKNKTKRDNFLIVSKIFLQDRNLSLTERGLLATMHSLPDEWEFTIAGMGKILPDGEGRIKSSLDGLVKKGYVTKSQIKTSEGRFGRNVIEINEKPPAEKRPADKRLAGKPPTENQGQYNNKEYRTKECNMNQSITLSCDGPMDGSADSNEYQDLIAANIRLDWLLEVASQHNDQEVQIVREIYDVICDMVCYSRDHVEIKGVTYPWHVVRAQFLKLRYQHVADVLNRIIDADLGIRNMSAYLISTLYTQSLVGTIEAEADLHDDYLKYLRGNPY